MESTTAAEFAAQYVDEQQQIAALDIGHGAVSWLMKMSKGVNHSNSITDTT